MDISNSRETEMRSLEAPFWESAESFLFARHDLKPWALKSYAKSLRRFDKWASSPSLGAFDTDLANAYVSSALRRGKRTLAHHDAVALSQVAQWLVETRVLRSDPLAGFKVPRQPVNRRQPFRDQDIPLIIEAARKGQQPERDVTIIALALACGLRKDEIRVLAWPGDIDLTTRTLYVRTGKTDSATREVPISPRVSSLIDSYVKDWRETKGDGALFVNRHGDAFSYDGWSSIFRRIRSRLPASVDFKLHRMRNTALTNWLRTGADIYTVSALAGHKSIAHTERYLGRMTPEQLRNVPDAFGKIYGSRAV